MKKNKNLTYLNPLNAEIASVIRVLNRPTNTLIFLAIRLILMSGMVVGFSWWALDLSP
jgi:predicted Na+-dependent transporter